MVQVIVDKPQSKFNLFNNVQRLWGFRRTDGFIDLTETGLSLETGLTHLKNTYPTQVQKQNKTKKTLKTICDIRKHLICAGVDWMA